MENEDVEATIVIRYQADCKTLHHIFQNFENIQTLLH